jgi:hypothetical protein
MWDRTYSFGIIVFNKLSEWVESYNFGIYKFDLDCKIPNNIDIISNMSCIIYKTPYFPSRVDGS